MFSFSTNSAKKLLTVHQDLQDVFLAAIRVSPIDFGISHGRRTADEQFELWKQGRTFKGGKWAVTGKIVTKCDGMRLLSKHQYAEAVDVFAFVNGKLSYDPVHLALIAGAVISEANSRNIPIRWGGTFGSREFKGWDMPHFEI